MTSKPTRVSPPSPRQLLARILEEPALVAAVQSLEGRVLGELIGALGLEDAGELVALATADQLCEILDVDLWKSERPGVDEQFDADRFARWLEVMLEAGEEAVARRILELPPELVTLGLHLQVLVVDFDALSVAMSEGRSAEHDLTEKAIESSLYQELGPYAVFSRRHDGWDAVLALLLALDRDHHAYLERLLARCAALSEAQIEEGGGLYQVLGAAETLAEDAAAEREERRAREGFLAPSSAASFLALARQTPLEELRRGSVDPILAAYFRELRRAERSEPEQRPGAARGEEPIAAPGSREVDRLTELLVEAEILEPSGEGKPAQLSLLGEGTRVEGDLFREALTGLRARGAESYPRRMEELGFLGNALTAGCSLGGRRLRGLEAAELVVATCNLGLDDLLGRAASSARARTQAEELLDGKGAVACFRVGWRRLHELSLAACVALAEALEARAELERGRSPAREVARLGFIAGKLREAAGSHKPWLARGRLAELGAILDPPTRQALEALLDECPTLGGALAPAGPAREGTPIASRRQLERASELLVALAPEPTRR